MKKSSKFIKRFKTFLLIVLVIDIVKRILVLTKLKKENDIFLFFDGTKRVYKKKKFESISICNIFGGMELDLREAILGESPVILEITGIFSGFSIKVNPEWNIKLEGTAKKSGISNAFKYDENNKDAPQLTIKYNLKFSGLDIK